MGDFILSSSADSTIRLWSTELNANLVCYKGHNYPVWDVQYSPVGHYFASASHDRTARIWSMERIQPLRIMAWHLSDVDITRDTSGVPKVLTRLDASSSPLADTMT
ncbi:transcription initiation factor TFIID subunit 5-like [Humulus lupulus]|uniref:transcription initiation factor TFIID subunit 5-like n=1 Tax=Humulus lupulus TaxID=3486 RepID=UPI002B411B65|nr:transcription initiation factor TFIID subunit 5-like [Humulus lupulus]